MKVLVKAFATFREVMDSQIDMDLQEGATILTLLDELTGRYRGLGEMMFDTNGTSETSSISSKMAGMYISWQGSTLL